MNMLARAVLGQQGSAAAVTGWVSSTTQGLMSNVSSHVVTLPTGRQVGDILVLTMTSVGSSTGGWTLPTGWSRSSNENTSPGLDIDTSVFYRIVDGSEAATVTFTYGSTTRWVGVCQLYRGYSTVTACEGHDILVTDLAPSATIGEWTGTPTGIASGDLIISAFTLASSFVATATDTFTNPAGTTVRDDYEQNNGGNRIGRIILADRVAAGSDTPGVWTSDAGNATPDKTVTAVLILNP